MQSAPESTWIGGSLPLRLRMSPAVPMTQDQFFDFCQQNRKLRLERNAQGELIIMPPAGGESSRQNLAVAAQLYVWAKRDGTGQAFDSSVGVILPNGANRSPDASWVLSTRLESLTPEQLKKFLPLCPDFVAEILSPSDSLSQTEDKLVEYVANGARLGWLLNPRNRRVHIYRPGKAVELVDQQALVSADPELPGFTLDLMAVWQP